MTSTFGRYRTIEACRICGNKQLVVVADLGMQALTGVFPRGSGAAVPQGPLELVRCAGSSTSTEVCGLVQLRHSYEESEMYGDNYGYRSGLNRTMVDHLRAKIAALVTQYPVGEGDTVLDIGSNDGTTLSFYSGPTRIGIDPTASKFAKYYQPGIQIVPAFFSADAFLKASGGKPAKIVTSIAMFYDLEDPMKFVKDVHDVLGEDGIWHFEQSYLPTMLSANAYDTICHEHLSYYALHQIEWMLSRNGLRIVDVSLNDTNGGSFAITAQKSKSAAPSPRVTELLASEQALDLDSDAPYAAFRSRMERLRVELVTLLEKLAAEGKAVYGMGASTKGNVILQYCGIDRRLVPFIAEVNEEKFGCATPGSDIPIIPEPEAMAKKPYALLVFPWHFRTNLVRRSADYLSAGGRLIFPLPEIDIVSS